MTKKSTGSAKSVERSSGSSKNSSGSSKNLYRNSDGSSSSKSTTSTNKTTSSAGKRTPTQRVVTISPKRIGHETKTNSVGSRSYNTASSTGGAERKNTSSSKTLYSDYTEKSTSARKYGRNRTSDDCRDKRRDERNVRDEKDKENEVDVGQLLYGIGEQAANKVVGGVTNALDLFIGTPFQKALDYAEEKLHLPDMGVNAITAYNKSLQGSSAKEAEYFAENASKNKAASKINQYAPDIIALLPEMVLAATSGGTTAVASTGVRGLNAASKLDNSADAMKIAGKWLKENPTAALNFLQTSGDAHKQAISEGATEQEALAYALLNGGMNGMISKYGVGAGKKGMESLPENLRNVWEKISTNVKSANAIAEEVVEGQIYGVMQRTSRGLYDNVKAASLNDENAVINPKTMLQDAAMDAVAPAVMGGADRRKGTPEPAKTKVDKELENGQKTEKFKKENKEEKGNKKNTGKKNTKKEEKKAEQLHITQSVLGGNLLKSGDFSKFNMRDPEIQNLISEKSGIHISRFDNLDTAILRRKIQLAAIEIAKKNAQENEAASKRSIEKPKRETYNKGKRK